MRPLGDPLEIQRVAARVLGETLGADWVGYAECDPESGIATIYRDFGAPSRVGRHPFGELPGFSEAAEARETVVLGHAPSVSPERASSPRYAGGGVSEANTSKSTAIDLEMGTSSDLGDSATSSSRSAPRGEVLGGGATGAFDAAEEMAPSVSPEADTSPVQVLRQAGGGTGSEDSSREALGSGTSSVGPESATSSSRSAPRGGVPEGANAADVRIAPSVGPESATSPHFVGGGVLTGDAQHGEGGARDEMLSVVAVPVVQQGRTIAMVAVVAKAPRAWTKEETFMAEEMAERTYTAVDRARIEAVLRKSESKYRSVFDTINAGVAICELITDESGQAVDYRFLDLNPAWDQLGGFTAEQCRGRTAIELLPEMEPFWIVQCAKAAIGRETIDLEQEGAEGSRFYKVRLAPFGEPADKQFVAALINVTDRALTEIELRATQSKQTFLLNLGDGLRPFTKPEDIQAYATRLLGEYLGAIRVMYSEVDDDHFVLNQVYFGGEIKEAKGRYPCDILGPKVVAAFKSGEALAIENTQESDLLTEEQKEAMVRIKAASLIGLMLKKDGRWVAALEAHSDIPRVWTSAETELIKDVADRIWTSIERVRATNALSEANERLTMALDTAKMGTFIWHCEEDRTEADPKMMELFGLPYDGELNLRTALDHIIHPDDREHYTAAVMASLDPAGSGFLRDDIRVAHPGGSELWIAVTGQTFFEGDPRKPTHIVGLVADITKQKRTEEALIEADRNKDQFLATLAHELRNPLTPIMYSAELLERYEEENSAVAGAAGMIQRQLHHLVRLIDDLLDVSRISRDKIKLQKERLDLVGLLRDVAATNQSQIDQSGHRLELALPEGVVYVEGDAVRLAQVFGNLFGNAIKYTPRGGVIGLQLAVDGGQAAVTVSDNGSGIPPDVLPKVFDLFTQADSSLERSQGGLGIGLALVDRLVAMHGGSVKASSEGLGKGSQFTVTLPLLADQGSFAASSVDGALAHELPRLRVLVVDDNLDAANTLVMLLGMEGYDATAVHDGLDAVEAAKTYKPDAILLDIGLPSLSGYEVCRAIRLQPGGRKILIVAVSGWGQEEDRRQSEEAGFDSHLVKPVMFDALMGVVGSLKAMP